MTSPKHTPACSPVRLTPLSSRETYRHSWRPRGTARSRPYTKHSFATGTAKLAPTSCEATTKKHLCENTERECAPPSVPSRS